MQPIIQAFLEICLLRRGPQDLPSSGFLLYLSLGLYALSGSLIALAYQPPLLAVALAISDTALLAALTVGVLYLHRRPRRVPQTLSALAGSGALLAVLALGPTWWWYVARTGDADPTAAAVMLLVLVVWGLVVMGHVLRHALSVPLIVGLVIAVTFYWIAVTVQNSLFPLPD